MTSKAYDQIQFIIQVRVCALSLTVSSIVGILKILKCTVYLITKIAAHSNIKFCARACYLIMTLKQLKIKYFGKIG